MSWKAFRVKNLKITTRISNKDEIGNITRISKQIVI